MELFECSDCLEPARESLNDRPCWRRVRPLLYVKGMALQVREKEGECVHVLPSLVAHAIGYEMIVGTHNTVHAQIGLAGFTVFTWYGKCRCLPYCKANVGAHNTIWVLTCRECCIVPT